MKNIRVFYKKRGQMRFVSHLDMNRLMIRLLRRSKLNVWYTEGYNSRPYVTFAIPLSLGFQSSYECFDFRLAEGDETDCAEILEKLNAVAPNGIEIFKVAEPVNKVGKIVNAAYKLLIDDISQKEKLENFLNQDTILAEKTTKKGTVKTLNLAEKIVDWKLEETNSKLCLNITLPAGGGGEHINPNLVISAFFEATGQSANYTVERTLILLQDGTPFI